MKKILFCINNLGGGGAEKSLVNLVNELCKDEQLSITVKVLFDGGINKQYLDSRIKYEYIFKKTFRGSSILSKILPARLLYKWFVGTSSFDIEVAYLEGILTKVISGSNHGAKKLAWIHTEFKNDGLFQAGFYNKQNAIAAYKKFDDVYTVSEESKFAFHKMSGLNATVAKNYINLQSFEEFINQNQMNKSEHINICTIGRLIEVKGYERLIKIAAKLANTYNFTLHIVGDGELRSSLELLIRESQLEDIVLLHGYVDPPYKILADCDIYICSSYREGYNTAVIESLLIGKAVLTTDCSGMQEILENGKYGMIVPNTDAALKIALEKILENPTIINSYTENIKNDDILEKYELGNQKLLEIFKR